MKNILISLEPGFIAEAGSPFTAKVRTPWTGQQRSGAVLCLAQIKYGVV